MQTKKMSKHKYNKDWKSNGHKAEGTQPNQRHWTNKEFSKLAWSNARYILLYVDLNLQFTVAKTLTSCADKQILEGHIHIKRHSGWHAIEASNGQGESRRQIVVHCNFSKKQASAWCITAWIMACHTSPKTKEKHSAQSAHSSVFCATRIQFGHSTDLSTKQQ